MRRPRLALTRFARFARFLSVLVLVVSVLFSISLFVRMARNPVAREME